MLCQTIPFGDSGARISAASCRREQPGWLFHPASTESLWLRADFWKAPQLVGTFMGEKRRARTVINFTNAHYQPRLKPSPQQSSKWKNSSRTQTFLLM
jgi:hypothetical protein